MEIPIKSLSPSGASTFDQCPKRWYHRYVEHIKDPPGEAQLLGTFVHEIFETLFGYDFDPSERTQENANLVARKVWDSFIKREDFKSLELDEKESRSFMHRSWEKVVGLWELEDPTQVDVYALELEVKVDIDGVPFYGFIDRIERTPQGLVVGDYKTGKFPESYVDDKLVQVFLYAEAMKHFANKTPSSVKLIFPGEGVIERPVTEDKLQPIAKKFRKTWAAIGASCESEKFKAVTGPLCGWCPHVGACEDGKQTVLKIYGKRTDKRPPAMDIIESMKETETQAVAVAASQEEAPKDSLF